MAFFRCGGGAKPIDLTDFASNSGVTGAVDVPAGSSISIPITKTPRYILYSVVSNSANYVRTYLCDVKNQTCLLISKTASATSFTVVNYTYPTNEVSITSNAVVITNIQQSARSIGVSVIY